MNARFAASVLATFALLAGNGCAASAPEEGVVAAESDLSAPKTEGKPSSCTFAQVRPYLTDEELASKRAAFESRNPGTWSFDSVAAFDHLSGAINEVRRAVTGPAVPVDYEAALNAAKTFARRNADLLDISPTELAHGTFRLTSLDGPNAVTFSDQNVIRGTEAYDPPLTRVLNITLFVGRDGAVERVRSWSSSEPETLQLCAEPATSASDALIRQNVLGTELIVTPWEFVPTTPAWSVGHVEATDIRDAKPMIFIAYGEEAQTLHVTWRINVERGGHTWEFFIDAATGAKLEHRQVF